MTSSSKNVLLVDIGNSFIKVARLSSPAKILITVASIQQLVERLQSLNPTQIWCACVRDAQALEPLVLWGRQKDVPFHEVLTQRSSFGLLNSYENVDTMGVDRWLSMVAVAQLDKNPFATISLGTAITCDVVANGKHQGGWIIPGRKIMFDAVAQNTEKVKRGLDVESNFANTFALGQSTQECVSLGCFSAAVGSIEMAKQWMQQNFESSSVYVSGGDVAILDFVRSTCSVIDHNLVISGLALFANAAFENSVLQNF